MDELRPFQIVASTSAVARLDAAAAFLRRFSSAQPVNVVAATRGAADEIVRRIAIERGATLGLARFSLTQLAARIAAPTLGGRGVAPATPLGAEAVSARIAFDAARDSSLTYFGKVCETPGFPRALARTLSDLRSSGVPQERMAAHPRIGPDLAALLRRSEAEFERAGSADRTRLLTVATAGVGSEAFLRAPLLLLDVPLHSRPDVEFVAALIGAAGPVLVTTPARDDESVEAVSRLGGVVIAAPDDETTDLAILRRHLFAGSAPAPRDSDGSLQFFSAPGEGRECVEIARRVHAEAARGVRFDEMAILVRSPQHYQGLLEHALQRAQVPAWFDRGTRRPHPAGRAFLALLSCAAEGLSARRFAEYLSLGQLPTQQHAGDAWTPSRDEALDSAVSAEDDEQVEEEAWIAEDAADGGAVAGTLRAPRRWERLLVEAAVIGGNPARWTGRLDGLDAEFAARLREARRQDPTAARVGALERDRAHLAHLRAFALPLIQELATWPAAADWGSWLERLELLAPRVLRVPAYVLRVLADLRPMATVGPASIHEVHAVLAARLRTVDSDPPPRRYGRVFVGAPAHVRGRAFRVVFVPGLAERMFPQKLTQDPLLLDEARTALEGTLRTRADQARQERVLLHLAAGAATERLYVSYPRLDVAEGRGRVPSFYALDLVRGVTGAIPDHAALASAAAGAGDAMLAWPAPARPERSIDDQEHDLAVLRRLLDARDPVVVRGRAQYMLRLNPTLRRSVTERWARGERKWSQFDGVVRVTNATRDALQQQRLGSRPYSLSALQRFAACPYQFFLSAIYRLAPADDPQPLQRLDPLTKGSMVHRMQAVTFRQLEAMSALPVTADTLDRAVAVLAETVASIASEYRELLAPAIPRVWEEEIAGIERDLRGWLRRTADEGGSWTPRYFELSFGLRPDAAHDPRSVPDPVTLEGKYTLRGSVDLVEEHQASGALRVTDYKTGKDRTRETVVIGGGAVLQPVLYSMVVEQITRQPVSESRLSFCTSAGGYAVKAVALTPQARRAGVEALEIIDRAIEQGSLAAAPSEGACTWCDFRPVCGPAEEQRVARKPKERLQDLFYLRSRL